MTPLEQKHLKAVKIAAKMDYNTITNIKQAAQQCAKISEDEIEKAFDWLAKEGLKKYSEGWCEAGGSNGFHLSTKELVQLFLQSKTTNS
jgi:hypothetical protein